MRRVYFCLYYRLYRFAKWVGTTDAPWTAMLLITVLIGLNIFALLSVFTERKDVQFLSSKKAAVSLTIIIGVINYVIFIRDEKYEKVIEIFKKESKESKTWSAILIVAYIIMTWYFAHLV